MRDTSTVSQLRHDIDSGLTRDKVAAPDPAAAPLGTDDEAAGTPASPQAVEMAHKEELQAGVEAAERPAATPGAAIYLVAMGGFFLLVILVSLAAQ